jgi:hypothetical protein
VFATFWIFVSGICAEMLTSAWWTKMSSCWCPKQRVCSHLCRQHRCLWALRGLFHLGPGSDRN